MLRGSFVKDGTVTLLQEVSETGNHSSLYIASAALWQALQLQPAPSIPSTAAVALVAAALSSSAGDAALEASEVVFPKLQQRDLLNEILLMASAFPVAVA